MKAKIMDTGHLLVILSQTEVLRLGLNHNMARMPTALCKMTLAKLFLEGCRHTGFAYRNAHDITIRSARRYIGIAILRAKQQQTLINTAPPVPHQTNHWPLYLSIRLLHRSAQRRRTTSQNRNLLPWRHAAACWHAVRRYFSVAPENASTSTGTAGRIRRSTRQRAYRCCSCTRARRMALK